MSRRMDYFDDPSAPAATSLVPGGAAVVVDEQGRLLLQRRADSGNWSLPGGTMELGETLGAAVVREVREETGLDVELTGILGIYTDPRHVIAYADGEVRQEFVIAFTARPVGGNLAVSVESTEVAWFDPAAVADLRMHESVRLRIGHWLDGGGPHIG
ncbi:NUDIX domain-containing protein [Micromonospora sp. WMMD1102]|uniref:NUDIX domain-containing protein n=1 Tax=Micromonospora sp. WMMD1102 TaxID=3016105 RepID=UPI0024150824|nr:NUDIX domain-containing protein [Micromonospora sp. WMMD1102]MDG4791421.1 NUDIX domain-containing protein [Micromonospora sp. WMMD1102]